MTYLAEQEAEELISIREISEAIEAPQAVLAKIIGTLARTGLVSARRGPKGGVTLAVAPAETTIGAIVQAVDGPQMQGRCSLGFRECSDKSPCPVHDSWKHVQAEMERVLHSRTLDDLSCIPGRTKKRKKTITRKKPRSRS
jgi:Rrf2 family protein